MAITREMIEAQGISREMIEGQAAHDDRPREPAGKRVSMYAPHELRLFDEMNELCARMEKLVRFLDGETAASLRQRDRDLLVLQLAHMRAYREVLVERVERLG